MVVRLNSGGVEGVDAYPVELEVDYVRQGLPGFTMVGLAETAVREAKDRVFAALRAANFKLPPARVTVNLAPAWRRKSGASYDLPLAMGLLAASGGIPAEGLQRFFMAGELSLAGDLRPVSGVLPLALLARQRGAAGIIVPPGNGAEAAVVRGLPVYAPRNIAQCAAFLAGAEPLEPVAEPEEAGLPPAEHTLDFAEVKGQEAAKRALEIAEAITCFCWGLRAAARPCLPICASRISVYSQMLLRLASLGTCPLDTYGHFWKSFNGGPFLLVHDILIVRQKHCRVAVPHEAGNCSYVHTCCNHFCAKCMAQVIGPQAACDTCSSERVAPRSPYPAYRTTIVVYEVVISLGNIFSLPFPEHRQQALPNWHFAPRRIQVFLCPVYTQDSAFQVNIIPCQLEQFTRPHTDATLRT